MPVGVGIPPWLSVGPLDPVQFYGQGLQLGQQAASIRNETILQGQRLAQATAEAAADRAMRQQIAEQQAQQDAMQFASQLMVRKQANEEAARKAALKYESIANYQRLIKAGVPPEQAILQSPHMFLDEPGGAAAFMRAAMPPQQRPATPGSLEKNIEYFRRLNPNVSQQELIEMAKAELTPSGFVLETTPGGGMSFRQGKVGAGTTGGLTVANQTRLQQDIQDNVKLLDIVGELKGKLEWKDVGAAGVFGEWVLDRTLPQIFASTPDVGRMNKRAKLKALVEGSLRQVSVDTRFTNEDRKDIKEVLPSSGAFETVERAEIALQTIGRIWARRNIRDRIALGQRMDMNQLTNEEIAAAVEMKLIGYDDAYNFLKANR